jgi:phage tail P2-like protein
MKLSTLEFIRLLPQFMRDDSAVKGLAAGIDQIVPQAAASAALMSTWDCIDRLSEAELDELAWELNIAWYDTTANIDIKRELVKNSDKVYQRLGTKWATENVIRSYFGDGFIEEWFEYGGEPGHFRVNSSNPSLESEKFLEFLHILERVKRATAKLDGVIITLSGMVTMSAGFAVHDIGSERYAIGASAI